MESKKTVSPQVRSELENVLRNLPHKFPNISPQQEFYVNFDPQNYFRLVTYDPSLKILGVSQNYRGFMFFFRCDPMQFSIWDRLDSETQVLQLHDMMPIAKRWAYHYYREMVGEELFSRPTSTKLKKSRRRARLK